jgi:hypothetical protein
MLDRNEFDPLDIVKEIWAYLDLPPSALSSLILPGMNQTPGEIKPLIPSSFKIGHLAQSTIALSAFSAALVYSNLGRAIPIPRTTIPIRHALLEFQCERLYTLKGKPPVESWGPIGGLHPTSDGHVRIHDVFPHHRRGALVLLGLPETCADRSTVSERTGKWKSIELETVAVEEKGLAIYALRSYAEWDALPQSRALADLPVSVRRLHIPTTSLLPCEPRSGPNESGRRSKERCLSGLRVLELSRVIAAPVAGKTLAAHGADVLWVTSPHLPDLPDLDVEFARGKRSIQLDLSSSSSSDKAKFDELARTADVVLQGYRPGSLAARGVLNIEELAMTNPGVVIANLSAFGPDGEWKGRRGFDSLVQTCSGISVSEGEHYYHGRGEGQGEAARALPCQALDHGAGFLLATGICAALYHREKDSAEGRRAGAYVVDVSLAGVGKYLRSLGQYEGRLGFEGGDLTVLGGVGEGEETYFETRQTAFGEMRFLKHSASIEDLQPGWDLMPTPLGSDEAVWSDS